MGLSSLLLRNGKPLFFHSVVVVIAGALNISVWGGSTSVIPPLGVFLISFGSYFILGTLMTDYGSFFSNVNSIILLPLLSLMIYAGTLIPPSDFEESFVNFLDLLFFIHIQPFLYFTGIPAKFDHPFLYSAVPSLTLFTGLQCKVAVVRLMRSEGSGGRGMVKRGEGS